MALVSRYKLFMHCHMLTLLTIKSTVSTYIMKQDSLDRGIVSERREPLQLKSTEVF